MKSSLACAALTALSLGLVLGACGPAETLDSADEQSALEAETPDAAAAADAADKRNAIEAGAGERSLSLSGTFSRTECVNSRTHSAAECTAEQRVGPGSLSVDFLDSLADAGADIKKVRVRVAVRSPGILEMDAPIDISFATELATSESLTMLNRDYEEIGRRFEGQSPIDTFPNNPRANGNRSVVVSADVMDGGQVVLLTVKLVHQKNLDESTTLALSGVP